MLDALRDKTGSWVVKIFIGVLAASFAVWGVADVFTTRPTDTLAEVGSRQISVQEYSNQFQRELRLLSQQLGQPLTAAQGRQFGLDRKVLGALLRDAALEAQADELKLMVSDKSVAQRIADNPQFQNSQGAFNKDQFLALLRNNGLSEQMFVIAEKQGLIRGAIATTIEQGAAVPKRLVEFAYKFSNEQRDATYFAVTVPETTVSEPSDSDLKTFYEANAQLFRVPERRVIAAIQVTPDSLSDRIQISDEDVAKRYEDRKADYGTLEKRTIQQIAFANVTEAAAAKAKIDGGASFMDIAKEMQLSETDINLGTFTQTGLPDQKLAEAAFGLAKDAISAPVEAKLSTVLLRVTNIEAGSQKPLSEVAGEIRKALQIDSARDEILAIYDKVEEFRASGQSFDDIAKELSLTVLETAPVDRTGHTESGALVENLVDTSGIVKAAFESDVGVDNDPVATPGDGYVWLEVRDIKAASTKPLADARDDAVKGWKAEALRKAVIEKAEDLKKRAEAGETVAKLASEIGAEVKTQQGIKRNEASESFETAAVQALFAVREDGIAVAVDGDGKGAKLMKSTPVLAVPYDSQSAEAKSLAKQLSTSFANDLYAQYLADLQRRLGVEINEKVLANAGNQRGF